MEEAEQAYRNALYYRSNMADMLYNLWVYVLSCIVIYILLSLMLKFICLWFCLVSVDVKMCPQGLEMSFVLSDLIFF